MLVGVVCSPSPAVRDTSFEAALRTLSVASLSAEAHSLLHFAVDLRNGPYERVRAHLLAHCLLRCLPQQQQQQGEQQQGEQQQQLVVRASSLLRQGNALQALMLLADNNNNSNDMSLSTAHSLSSLSALLPAAVSSLSSLSSLSSPLSSSSLSLGSPAVCSLKAAAHRLLAFQLLSSLVRREVRAVPRNAHLFDASLPQPALLPLSAALQERTPVRMDLSHSCWSDIFFLCMDNPDGARVLNVSVDLAIFHPDHPTAQTAPPVQCYLRRLPAGREHEIVLTSIDLRATATVTTLREMFDFSRDYLGLLKAGIIASGLVPPWMEDDNTGRPLPGGFELISHVQNIPKGEFSVLVWFGVIFLPPHFLSSLQVLALLSARLFLPQLSACVCALQGRRLRRARFQMT